MRFCGLEAHQVPTFDNPMPDLRQAEKLPPSDGTLGHACDGELVPMCSKMWTFKPADLQKHQMTQLQALERTCCRICRTPPDAHRSSANGQ